MNIDFTDIDNSKLIGRLLPFWARGRRLSLLLQAVLSPIKTVHETFRTWALEKYIECHITAQRASLEWYLKHRLGPHFKRPDDSFIISRSTSAFASCFSTGRWRGELPWISNLQWDSGTGEHEDFALGDRINVLAPAIVNTVDYSGEDYERDIRLIMSKYMINFDKINIKISGT